MKKVVIILLCMCVLGGIFAFAPADKDIDSGEFLRVHIRADSNKQADQTVKYKVKDAVVEFLTPHLSQCQTKAQAINVVKSKLKDIEKVCDSVLNDNGFDYKSSAALKSEYFPTRSYDGVVLGSGSYDSLIINLGGGSGDNWWCVVYPPLCFVGGSDNGTQNIVYKSKILEIIENWKSKHNK